MDICSNLTTSGEVCRGMTTSGQVRVSIINLEPKANYLCDLKVEKPWGIEVLAKKYLESNSWVFYGFIKLYINFYELTLSVCVWR